jgi:K+-sensing histidine kinase KdpD
MSRFLTRDRVAVFVALAAPLALAAILVPFRASFPNTDAALAMLLVVVAVAANGYRLAGILAAVSAAVWFDFFLTRPYEQFTITRRTDIETTILLLIIGIAVTELAVWGRRQQTAASRRAGYLDGINAAAQSVATGGSPSALIDQVSRQLTQLLSLRACRFQYGAAGLGQPARMRHDGTITVAHQAWDADSKDFPPGTDTELLVEAAACSRAGS